MSGVSHNWDLYFGIIWFLFNHALLVRVHSDLHACRQGSIRLVVSNISVLQTWSHWVNIEEWVFPMLYVCHWLSVNRLVSLIPYSWQVKVGALLLNFNSLEPSIQLQSQKKRVKLTQHHGS